MAYGDDDSGQRPGLSGTAAAFQRGSSMASQKKQKAPKQKKQKDAGPVSSSISQGLMKAASSPGGFTGVPSMKKGGRVKKTGVYRLHAGETVVPAEKKTRRKGAARKRVSKG